MNKSLLVDSQNKVIVDDFQKKQQKKLSEVDRNLLNEKRKNLDLQNQLENIKQELYLSQEQIDELERENRALKAHQDNLEMSYSIEQQLKSIKYEHTKLVEIKQEEIDR